VNGETQSATHHDLELVNRLDVEPVAPEIPELALAAAAQLAEEPERVRPGHEPTPKDHAMALPQRFRSVLLEYRGPIQHDQKPFVPYDFVGLVLHQQNKLVGP